MNDLYTSQPWALKKEIARLNKKAARIGVSPIDYTDLGKVERTRVVLVSGDGETSERVMPVTVSHFQLVLPEPSERSWVPLAKITPIEGGRPFVEALQAGYDLTPWADANPQDCDHCHAKRNRIVSYVVRNPEGKVLQLGRNCFQDYVGKDTLAQFEFIAVIQANLGGDEEGFYPMGGGCGVVPVVETREVVARAEALCLVDGWMNNVKDTYSGHLNYNGTHRVAAKRGGEHKHSTEALKSMNQLEDKSVEHPARALADAAILRMRDMVVAEDDEFALALKNIAEYDVIPEQKASLAAYVGQYVRSQDLKAQEAVKNATRAYRGTVGQRETFADLTCVRCPSFPSDYGTVYVNTFEDAAGNVIVWKTGSYNAGIGDKVTLVGTVKDHSEYRGTKQTILTRCKEVVPPHDYTPNSECALRTCTVCGKRGFEHKARKASKPLQNAPGIVLMQGVAQ